MSREIPFPVGRVEDAQFRAKRRAVVKIALGKLAKILGTKQDPTDVDVIDAFTDATAFIAPRFVTAAADVIISTSEYFPKPAELRKAAVELAERQRRADAAARNIQRVIPTDGTCPQCLEEYVWCVPADSVTGAERYMCHCQRLRAEQYAARLGAGIHEQRAAYQADQERQRARSNRSAEMAALS